MHEADMAIAGVVGFAIQWLRQYRWFTDGMVLAVALAGGALATIANHPEAMILGPFINQTAAHTLAMLGGTFTAHMASHQMAVVPKYNGGSK